MSHNARIRPPGDWTGDLEPEECDQIDTLQFEGLSKRGGAWCPADPIELGSGPSNEGLEVTGPCLVEHVIRLVLATSIAVEYDSYEVEREHLPVPGLGSGFAVQRLVSEIRGIATPEGGDADVPVLQQTEAEDDPTNIPRWWVPLSLPVGCVITKLTVTLTGQFAHDTDDEELPRQMPRIALHRANSDDGGGSAGFPEFDPSTTMAEYRNLHDIVLTHINSPTFDGTQLWWAVIDGEYGEHASAGLYVTSVRTTTTQTTHDEHQI